jgi:hypothetical protein
MAYDMYLILWKVGIGSMMHIGSIYHGRVGIGSMMHIGSVYQLFSLLKVTFTSVP